MNIRPNAFIPKGSNFNSPELGGIKIETSFQEAWVFQMLQFAELLISLKLIEFRNLLFRCREKDMLSFLGGDTALNKLGIICLHVRKHNKLVNRSGISHIEAFFMKVRVGLAPFSSSNPKHNQINDIGFCCIWIFENSAYAFPKLTFANNMLLHGIGLQDVIGFRKDAFDVPFTKSGVGELVLKVLVLLDEKEFELGVYPRAEFEGDVFLSIGPAVPASLGDKPYCPSGFYPLPCGHHKSVKSRCSHNFMEGFCVKIGVVQGFPQAHELDGILVTQPFFYQGLTIFDTFNHVGKTDIVLVVDGLDGNGFLKNVYDYIFHAAKVQNRL